MKFAVYTSCSVNYLPKARVLADSLKAHHQDATLVLCLNDIAPAGLNLAMEPFDDIWTPHDLGYDDAFIFKHNVMELCTAVKGRAVERLLERYDADFHLYLDPDVVVYAPLDPIASYMEGADIGLVPHILKPEDTEVGVRLTEMSVTEHGIYNLGHLILRKSPNAEAFAAWWRKRLDEYCFDDKKIGLFTDQRWVDLAPAIFDGVRIIRRPTLDVASWNLATRDLRYGPPGGAAYLVDGEEMLTYHFSGTGPSGTHRRIREIFAPSNEAAAKIELDYEAAIAAKGQADLEHHPFAYDAFDNGAKVTSSIRKLYRDHKDLQAKFPAPFAAKTGGANSYFRWLCNKRPHLLDRIVIPESRLEPAFSELFDESYYLGRYPDAAAAVAAKKFRSALDHYVVEGSRRLYDPNEFFVSSYYFERAKDLDGWRTSGVKPEMQRTLLWHYLTVGVENGIEPIEYFDGKWYLGANPDLQEAFRQGAVKSPLGHFLVGGASENRRPGPGFDAEAYSAAVAGAGDAAETASLRALGAFRHYVQSCGVEGRALESPPRDRMRHR